MGTILTLTMNPAIDDDAVMFGVAAGSAAVMTRRHELCRLADAQRLLGEVRGLCAARATEVAMA